MPVETPFSISEALVGSACSAEVCPPSPAPKADRNERYGHAWLRSQNDVTDVLRVNRNVDIQALSAARTEDSA